MLILSQMHYPGWHVFIDKIPAALLRVDYAFAGAHISPGEHDVQFLYEPWTFRAGAILCVISVTIAAGLLFSGKRMAGIPLLAAATAIALALVICTAFIAKSTSDPITTGPPQLIISKTEVTAGEDAYTITILGARAQTVTIRYSLNGSSPQEFTVPLDSLGERTLDVPATTAQGTYRFLEFRLAEAPDWIPAQTTITVNNSRSARVSPRKNL